MTHRYRGIRVEQYGTRTVAVVLDRERDLEVRVYFRLGRWRRFADDEPVPAGVAGVARRLVGPIPAALVDDLEQAPEPYQGLGGGSLWFCGNCHRGHSKRDDALECCA